MTKTNILKIANSVNDNKSIKWAVLENSKHCIALGNSYDSNVRFEIRLHQGLGKDIKILDTFGWKSDAGYLIYGDGWYTDFTDEDEGIKLAIITAVGHFYYFY